VNIDLSETAEYDFDYILVNKVYFVITGGKNPYNLDNYSRSVKRGVWQ
jgi:hypothetical protein